MPVSDLRLKDGIFYSVESGSIEEGDAREWVAALQRFAAESPQPLVVLVDARQVEYVSAAAGRVFQEGARTPNVKMSVVVTGRPPVIYQARSIGQMSEAESTHETQVFEEMRAAEHFAQKMASQAANGRQP